MLYLPISTATASRNMMCIPRTYGLAFLHECYGFVLLNFKAHTWGYEKVVLFQLLKRFKMILHIGASRYNKILNDYGGISFFLYQSVTFYNYSSQMPEIKI